MALASQEFGGRYRVLPEVETLGTARRDLPMRGHDRHAAARPVRGDHGLDAGGCIGVERDGRLVQQPERRRRRQHAGEREPPLLPGREIASGNVGKVLDAERRERFGCGPRGTLEPRPAVQVLGRRERRLHGIEVAHVVQAAAMGGPVLVDGCAVPRERSIRPLQEARREFGAGSTCPRRWARRARAHRPAPGETRHRRRPGAPRGCRPRPAPRSRRGTA